MPDAITSPNNVASSTTNTAVNKAAKAAGVTAAAVSETLPTVVETAELAMEVPTKVVLNQRLIVVASIVGGAALGAGILFGVQKLRDRKKNKVLVPDTIEDIDAGHKS